MISWLFNLSGAVWEGTKDESMSNEVLNSKIKRLEMDNLHLKTQTENLRNSNAKVNNVTSEIFNKFIRQITPYPVIVPQ